MLADPRVKKINGTNVLTCEKKKKIRYYFAAAMAMFGIMFVSFFVLTTSGTSGPVWTLPLEKQAAEAGLFISVIIFLVLFIKFPFITFEKRIFLGLYKAYNFLSRYNSLEGSSSQEQSDFEKAFESLKKVSLELKGGTERVKYTDIGTEINKLFNKMGELIQTRILSSMQKKKDLQQHEENILQLADAFADVTFNRIQATVDNLEKLEKSESIALKSSFLESHPRVRFYYIHAYKLIGSLLIVFSVALIFSIIFQKPISDFAVAIFAAFFVLFGAWEFKSNK
jgi:hypothetical protein